MRHVIWPAILAVTAGCTNEEIQRRNDPANNPHHYVTFEGEVVSAHLTETPLYTTSVWGEVARTLRVKLHDGNELVFRIRQEDIVHSNQIRVGKRHRFYASRYSGYLSKVEVLDP